MTTTEASEEQIRQLTKRAEKAETELAKLADDYRRLLTELTAARTQRDQALRQLDRVQDGD